MICPAEGQASRRRGRGQEAGPWSPDIPDVQGRGEKELWRASENLPVCSPVGGLKNMSTSSPQLKKCSLYNAQSNLFIIKIWSQFKCIYYLLRYSFSHWDSANPYQPMWLTINMTSFSTYRIPYPFLHFELPELDSPYLLIPKSIYIHLCCQSSLFSVVQQWIKQILSFCF